MHMHAEFQPIPSRGSVSRISDPYVYVYVVYVDARRTSEIFGWVGIGRFWIFGPLVFRKHSHYRDPRVFWCEMGVVRENPQNRPEFFSQVLETHRFGNLRMSRNRSFLNIWTSGFQETLPLQGSQGFLMWNGCRKREPTKSIFFTSVGDTPVLNTVYVA